MIKTLTILATILLLVTTASAQRQAVVADQNGVVVSPSNFWEANAPPAQEYPYPVFRLEPPYGAPWTDFEIKASRDNFQTLEYYFHSPAPLVSEVGEFPVVYFSESGTAREWRMLVDEPTGNIIVSGAGTTAVNGVYVPATSSDPIFNDPYQFYRHETNRYCIIRSSASPWIIHETNIAGEAWGGWFYTDAAGAESEAQTPDQVVAWANTQHNNFGGGPGALPVPTVTADPETSRASIAQLLTDNNSEVGGIVVVITDPAVINSMNDTELVWSYTWFDASTSEKDNAGRQIWRSILPAQWVTEPTQP
jgi:hypothetical protein